MICFPNAKINLGLNIVSKRADGYHDLETVFYPVMIHDALEIITSEKEVDSFHQSGLQVDSPPENNLVMRALQLMRTRFEIPPLEIHLLKKIPFGAGIGGGSADAAFMLRLLNDAFGLNLVDDELAAMAVQLGADCPFFIYNRPMFASGIGEVLTDVDVSLSGYYIALIKPDIHIPTRDAFALINPRQPALSLQEIISRPVSEWKDLMHNDFEESIFPKYQTIEQIKNKLYDRGALYASMSGSGSSVYGIFPAETNLKSDFPDCYVWEERK